MKKLLATLAASAVLGTGLVAASAAPADASARCYLNTYKTLSGLRTVTTVQCFGTTRQYRNHTYCNFWGGVGEVIGGWKTNGVISYASCTWPASLRYFVREYR